MRDATFVSKKWSGGSYLSMHDHVESAISACQDIATEPLGVFAIAGSYLAAVFHWSAVIAALSIAPAQSQ
jgi:hypothetical protein